MKSLITAAQNQALNMRYYQRNIMKQPVDSKQSGRTHKTYCCRGTTLVPSNYTNRHNKVAGYIHWIICKHTWLQVTDKYYEHVTERDINVNSITITWAVLLITDRTITANRPHIVLHDKMQKTCLLTNISIPDDSSINTKETEN
jgi:hypothetical protein